jgi:putative ABC transport system permease protein
MEFNGMEFSGTVDNSIGNEVITREMRLEELERDMVSNRVSAVINQVMGCLIGAVMLYLALLLNFHDNQEDMGILKQLGYTGKEIKRMLIDIYKPVLLISFLLTLAPSIMLVRKILRSLSLQIGDYMPFKTNSVVILGVFVCLYGIYYIVLLTFRSCMRKL